MYDWRSVGKAVALDGQSATASLRGFICASASTRASHVNCVPRNVSLRQVDLIVAYQDVRVSYPIIVCIIHEIRALD